MNVISKRKRATFLVLRYSTWCVYILILFHADDDDDATFKEQRKKWDLWHLHLLEGVPVGLVVQRGILQRHFQNKCVGCSACTMCMHMDTAENAPFFLLVSEALKEFSVLYGVSQ